MRDILKKLTERPVWPMDELPGGVGVDELRQLDLDGLVEVRSLVMQNTAKYPGDPSPPAPVRGAWFSPVLKPMLCGRWDQLATKTLRDARHHPPEIRLTEKGLAGLASENEARVVEPKPIGHEPATPPEAHPTTPVEKRGADGFITEPLDPAAYVPMKEILEDCPAEWKMTRSRLTRLLDNNIPSIRQYRPRSKRRGIHRDDWESVRRLFLAAHAPGSGKKDKGWVPSTDEIRDSAAKIRAENEAKKREGGCA